MMSAVFSMINLDANDSATAVMNPWAMYMALFALYTVIVIMMKNISFNFVGANVTLNIRRDFYQAVMRKHQGWHDNRSNSAPILSGILAADCT